jgi:hypothetical protein
MKDINGIVDVIFNTFSAVRAFIWNLLKIPFEFWFSLPAFVHWIAFTVIVLIAAFIAFLVWKYREEWRHLYVE